MENQKKETSIDDLKAALNSTFNKEEFKQKPIDGSKITTLGESRIMTSFNPSNMYNVSLIKQKSAELIDLLQSLRNDEVSKTYDKSPEAKLVVSGEKLRLISLAQTSYEEAAMWAVKAATA